MSMCHIRIWLRACMSMCMLADNYAKSIAIAKINFAFLISRLHATSHTHTHTRMYMLGTQTLPFKCILHTLLWLLLHATFVYKCSMQHVFVTIRFACNITYHVVVVVVVCKIFAHFAIC